MTPKKEIILGIDPGTAILGYGLIAIHSPQPKLAELGILKLQSKQNHAERLGAIFEKITALMKHYKPIAVAIEAPFYGNNVQSMLKLGRAQGVAIAAAMSCGITTAEYAPRKIKQSITGNGNATKEQVWVLLQQILQFKEEITYLDASDALAVALCHHYQMNSPIPTSPTAPKKSKNKSATWEGFISSNPDRLLTNE